MTGQVEQFFDTVSAMVKEVMPHNGEYIEGVRHQNSAFDVRY